MYVFSLLNSIWAGGLIMSPHDKLFNPLSLFSIKDFYYYYYCFYYYCYYYYYY